MKLLLLMLALVAELVAVSTWLGPWHLVSDRHAHGFVALGLVLWLLALQPALPRPPASPRGR